MRFLGVELPYAPAWRDLVQRRDFLQALQATEAMIRPDATANRMTPSRPEQIFRILTVSDVKVVIVGQDPYYNVGEATGFAFEDGTVRCWKDLRSKPRAVPSLKRLLRKLHMEYTGNPIPTSLAVVADGADSGTFPILPPYELFAYWADQGVLLLNRRLSTRVRTPHAHKEAWEVPVEMIAAYVVARWPNAIWFFWGEDAKGLAEHVPQQNQIRATHPNPRGVSYADPTHFIHTDCFTRTPEIDWLGVSCRQREGGISEPHGADQPPG